MLKILRWSNYGCNRNQGCAHGQRPTGGIVPHSSHRAQSLTLSKVLVHFFFPNSSPHVLTFTTPVRLLYLCPMPFAVVGTTVPKSANNRITAPQVYSCAHYHHFASAPTAAAANGTKLVRPSQRLEAHARRSSIHSSDDEWVTFDGEDEWNEQVGKSVRHHACFV